MRPPLTVAKPEPALTVAQPPRMPVASLTLLVWTAPVPMPVAGTSRPEPRLRVMAPRLRFRAVVEPATVTRELPLSKVVPLKACE